MSLPSITRVNAESENPIKADLCAEAKRVVAGTNDQRRPGLEVELWSIWGRDLVELYSNAQEVRMCLQCICSHAPNQVGIVVEVSRVDHAVQVWR